MQSLKTPCAFLFATLLLVACGGGGGGSDGGDAVERPVANAGPDQTVEMGGTVTLDGSASHSPRSEAELSYTWTLADKPARSTAELSDESVAQPQLVTDLPGTYAADLVVNDGTADSRQDRVIITATNPDPVAIAQTEYHELIGTTVLLDGGESVPPTGGDAALLTYQWTLESAPTDSTAMLAQTGTAMTSFYADVAGQYSVTLVVHYQERASAPLTLTITASEANTTPVANAGGPYTVERGQTLTLDGSGSSDADGDELSYRWYMISPGSDTGFAPIWIPNGSALTVETALQDHDTATPTLTPDVAGTWDAYLVVYDGTSISNFSNASITVTAPQGAPNTPPVATFQGTPRIGFITPGQANEVELGDTIWSSGNSYDIDGTRISSGNRRYQWISTPAGYAQSDLTGQGSFSFTPTEEGQYTVEMVVNDGEADSEPARRTFIARTGANRAPSAAMTLDSQTIMVGSDAWFDGSTSSDPDDNRLTYHWHLLDRPDGSNAQLRFRDVTRPDGAVLSNARAGLTADRPGIYMVLLAVRDSHGVTSTTTSTTYGRVLAKSENNPPVIGSISNDNDHFMARRRNTHFNDTDQPYVIGGSEALTFYAQNAVDPDLDTLYYLWTLDQPVGSDLTEAGVEATFAPGTPTIPGTYNATAVVSDGIETSEPQTLSFRAVERADYPSLMLEDYYSAELNYWDRNMTTLHGADALPFQRAFPYWHHDDTSFPVFSHQLEQGDNVIKNYRLTAYQGSYTITNLRVATPTRDGAQVFSGGFVGLSEGMVIGQGESIDFSLALNAPADANDYINAGNISPDPDRPYDQNVLIGMTYTFEIAEKPGWRFEYQPACY
ncbi:PKD domain-containing protein [Alloalcanivorax sp. C16-1]|uniref:PKD domain-containing protein n=1 Tax=Alloalcanivorax sp. C16-1 TaxID=3390051 RepID=UPI003970C0DA